ncbi:NfeD-like domain protein [Candidatus Cyrtobacter comes]|uniref:NfeD-like domain protein n=1 Tax=Candidatus Cyrtobacter comes TaxID=675776 RepID=A0ABU5L6B7_9RICK|nr:hypothetical protein [Candidatus Cyrtobacter comes]MDZ5761674.1 NfeD-like domain protein [Candidatus Cyrtobacter comes]
MFEYLVENIDVFWAVFGVFLLLAELILGAFFLLFIMGLSAILVSVVVFLGVTPDFISQLSLFSFLFIVISVLSWRRIKGYFIDKRQHYNNIVGSSAVVVGGDIEPGKIGKIKWSGTTCNASSSLLIKNGSSVVIVENIGNIFFVKEGKE